MSELGDAYKRARYAMGGGKPKKPTHKTRADNLQRSYDALKATIKYKSEVSQRAVLRADEFRNKNNALLKLNDDLREDIIELKGSNAAHVNLEQERRIAALEEENAELKEVVIDLRIRLNAH